LRLAPYAALSGQRVVAELERILVEPHAAETLARLGRGGAFRLLDPRYRFTAATGRLVTELPGTLAWARQRGLGAEPVELAALEWYLGLDRAPVSLSGDEVIALGVPRGPAVARVLTELRDGRLDGRITDRATEIEQVRRLLTKGG